MQERLNYWRRIFRSYLFPRASALSFWHERPAVSPNFNVYELGPYYMTFADKADYRGPRDDSGVILLDYQGDIGRQYNPIAIAQYGLAHLNLYLDSHSENNLNEAKRHGDWLVSNLKKNSKGVEVWPHDFSWRYREPLLPGWYSALAQGAGLSLIIRLYKATGDEKYLDTARRAYAALLTPIESGGVQFIDDSGDVWLEEYLVNPPTHILNGFLWTLWGVWDYYLLTREKSALELFEKCSKTIEKNLPRYDLGFWSLYDLSDEILRMIASPFYHRLHIVQLEVMSQLTSNPIFGRYAKRWTRYGENIIYQLLALVYKIIFKLIYF